MGVPAANGGVPVSRNLVLLLTPCFSACVLDDGAPIAGIAGAPIAGCPGWVEPADVLDEVRWDDLEDDSPTATIGAIPVDPGSVLHANRFERMPVIVTHLCTWMDPGLVDGGATAIVGVGGTDEGPNSVVVEETFDVLGEWQLVDLDASVDLDEAPATWFGIDIAEERIGAHAVGVGPARNPGRAGEAYVGLSWRSTEASFFDHESPAVDDVPGYHGGRPLVRGLQLY